MNKNEQNVKSRTTIFAVTFMFLIKTLEHIYHSSHFGKAHFGGISTIDIFIWNTRFRRFFNSINFRHLFCTNDDMLLILCVVNQNILLASLCRTDDEYDNEKLITYQMEINISLQVLNQIDICLHPTICFRLQTVAVFSRISVHICVGDLV